MWRIYTQFYLKNRKFVGNIHFRFTRIYFDIHISKKRYRIEQNKMFLVICCDLKWFKEQKPNVYGLCVIQITGENVFEN